MVNETLEEAARRIFVDETFSPAYLSQFRSLNKRVVNQRSGQRSLLSAFTQAMKSCS